MQKTANGITLAGSTVLIIFFLVVAGCTSHSPAGRLIGTEWTLVQYTQNAKTVPAPAGTPVTIAFGDDGKITGSAGCNRYFATWGASGSALTIGQAGSTMMSCSEPGAMDLERAYLDLLPKAVSFVIDSNRLVISDKSGNAILTFTKTTPAASLQLIETNWTLSSIQSGNTVSSVVAGSRVTAVFDSGGKMAGSSGCNNYVAVYTANGTSLTISSIGSTMMACPEQEIMNQESRYLAALGSVQGYWTNGSTLVLTGNGSSSLLTFSGLP
jgi:heat shock protein HslJ